jgi:hypothetical protein
MGRFELLLDPWRSFAELGRNVNERLKEVVRDAAVIGNRRTVAAIRTDGSGLPLENSYLFRPAATVCELDGRRRDRSVMTSLPI